MKKYVHDTDRRSEGGTADDPIGTSGNATDEVEDQDQPRTDVVAVQMTGRRVRTGDAAEERPTKKAKIDDKNANDMEGDSDRAKGSGSDHGNVVEGTAECVTEAELEGQDGTDENDQTRNSQQEDQKAERKETPIDTLHSTITNESGPSGTTQDEAGPNTPICEEDDVNEEDLIEIDLNNISDLQELVDDDSDASDIENKNASDVTESADDKDCEDQVKAFGSEHYTYSTERHTLSNTDEEAVNRDTEDAKVRETLRSENEHNIEADENGEGEQIAPSDSDVGTENESSSDSNDELDSSDYSGSSSSDADNLSEGDDSDYLHGN